jgi:hypothetical protein
MPVCTTGPLARTAVGGAYAAVLVGLTNAIPALADGNVLTTNNTIATVAGAYIAIVAVNWQPSTQAIGTQVLRCAGIPVIAVETVERPPIVDTVSKQRVAVILRTLV